MPILCPAGYVCNSESLISPQNVCRIGRVCISEVMSGLLLTEMSCAYLQVISENILCDANRYRHY